MPSPSKSSRSIYFFPTLLYYHTITFPTTAELHPWPISSKSSFFPTHPLRAPFLGNISTIKPLPHLPQLAHHHFGSSATYSHSMPAGFCFRWLNFSQWLTRNHDPSKCQKLYAQHTAIYTQKLVPWNQHNPQASALTYLLHSLALWLEAYNVSKQIQYSLFHLELLDHSMTDENHHCSHNTPLLVPAEWPTHVHLFSYHKLPYSHVHLTTRQPPFPGAELIIK
jgi:hypothetical protein